MNKDKYMDSLGKKVSKPKKKKLKRLNVSDQPSRQLAGQVASTIVAQIHAQKGKSKKAKVKILGQMMGASALTEAIMKQGPKLYNKVVDKINKKRGY